MPSFVLLYHYVLSTMSRGSIFNRQTKNFDVIQALDPQPLLQIGT